MFTCSATDNEAYSRIKAVGSELSNDHFPSIGDGGVVLPCDVRSYSFAQGMETKNELEQRESRSAARPRKWSSRWKGPSIRYWPPRRAPSLFSWDIRDQYRNELESFLRAYPKSEIQDTKFGLWMRVPSQICYGIEKPAIFVVFIPYSKFLRPKSWGFWQGTISRNLIGPRHTNFPDGSICAFEYSDGTWAVGDSLCKLIDLYTLWAFRHLHLSLFGIWPGRQFVPFAYERLNELNDVEFCGCRYPKGSYKNCCKQNDQKQNSMKLRFEYFDAGHIGMRQPSNSIYMLSWSLNDVPKFIDLYALEKNFIRNHWSQIDLNE